MNPIHPWVDPAEVRRLAEKLLAPVNQTLDEPSTDPGFDSGFVGFAANPPPAATAPPGAADPAPPPATPARAAVVSAPPPAAGERSIPAPPAPVPVPAPVELPSPAAGPASATQAARGQFLERLHRFRDWLHHHFAATGIFILDRDGAVIFDDSGHGKLHFLARSLALASRRPGCQSGIIQVKIGTTAALEVIPVETRYGWLVLGAVVPAALPPAAIPVIVEALTQAVVSPSQNPA